VRNVPIVSCFCNGCLLIDMDIEPLV
jgi:hypothetical protein